MQDGRPGSRASRRSGHDLQTDQTRNDDEEEKETQQGGAVAEKENADQDGAHAADARPDDVA